MYYNDVLPIGNQKVIKLKLSDFSGGINTDIDANVLPMNMAHNTYNFDFSSGSLKPGMGFRDLLLFDSISKQYKTMEVPSTVSQITKTWMFRRWDDFQNFYSPLLIFYTADNKFYAGLMNLPITEFLEMPSSDSFSKTPVGMNLRVDGVNKFFWCPSKSGEYLACWDGYDGIEHWPSAPEITGLAYHANRLFATIGGDKTQLWFSSDTDPTNWVALDFYGGYIEMSDERGMLNSVISYNNYLYVIREFGITRVSGAGEQNDFVVRHLTQSNSKIYSSTATLCGDRIMMLCRDGLYRFDGMEMSKVMLGFENLFKDMDNTNAVGAFLDGKYYLACKMRQNDYQTVEDDSSKVNNTLLEYDIKTGEYSLLRGVDIRALTELQYENMSKLVVNFNDDGYKNRIAELTHDGKIFGVPTQKVWESPSTDLGYPGSYKIIKSIELLNRENSKLGIYADGKVNYFDLPASNKPIRVPINIRATTFAVGFYSSEENCYISNPQLEVALE